MAVAGARGDEAAARRWLDERAPPAARDHRRRPRRGRAERAARSARRWTRRPRRCCAATRPTARSSSPPRSGAAPSIERHGDRHAPAAPRAVPLGGRAHRRRPAGRAARCSPRAAAASRPAPFASLNLGRLTDDDGANVDENRDRVAAIDRRAARALPLRPPGPRRDASAAPPSRPARTGRPPRRTGRRPRSATIPALVFAADCLPVLLAADGAVAALHGGWRGAGRRHRRPRASPRCASSAAPARSTALIGPARARLLLRGRRGGPRALRRLRRPPRRAQPRPRRPSRASSSRGRRGGPRRRPVHDVPARAVLLPPPRRRRHRAPGGGRVAGLITGLDAGRRARERSRASARELPATASSCSPPSSTSRSRSSARSPRPASTLRRREPRAGPRGQGRPRIPARSAGTSSASSRAARSRRSSRTCELIHSVASDSALRQLERHGTPETEVLVEVNVAGEEGKAGVAPGRARRLHRRAARCASPA